MMKKKMMRRSLRKLEILGAFFLGGLSVLPSGLMAQESRNLSLDEAIKLGLENSKTLKVSDSKVSAAMAKVSETDASRLPSLKVAGGYTRLSYVEPFDFSKYLGGSQGGNQGGGKALNLFPSILDNASARVSLTQPVFTGFRLQAASDLSQNSLKAGLEDYQKDRGQLVYDIKNAYWSYYKGMEIVKSLDDNINLMKAHLADIESMSNSGLATNNDVLKVKVQVSNMEYSKLDAESNVSLGMMALNNLIGLPIETNINTTDKIEEKDIVVPALVSATQEAYSKRPELKAMQYRIRAGESGVKMAESAYYPQVFLGANYNFANPNQRVQPQMPEFTGTWDAGVTISYDLWNWGTAKYQTQQAQESLEQTKLGLSQLKDAVQLDVSQSYLSLVKAKQKLPVAEQAIEQAEENFRVTRVKFKGGLATNTDVIDAETALMTSRTNYTSALVDIELAKAKLEKAMGK